MASKNLEKIIEKRKQEYEKELNKKIKGEKVPPQDDKSSVKPTRKPIKIKNHETAYEKYIFDKQEESEKMLDKLNASYYNTPKTLAERNRPLRLSQKIINKDTGKRIFYLWPNKGRTLGLNTRIINNYTENPKREPKMSYAVPLYYTQNLPEGWRHNVVGMDNKDQEMVGLSYWTGPIKYKDRGDGKKYTIEVTILDYPSKKRLEEEAKYYTLTTYKGKEVGPEHLTPKENKMLDELLDKFDENILKKKDKRKKDLEEDTPGGKSFFEEGVKTREDEKKPSKIFGYKWGDFKVGGRKRKTRRKQRGGNTPPCQTRQLTYEQLDNRTGETFYVKAPILWEGMNDGRYKLVEYNIEDRDAADRGQPGILGIGLETPDGENAFFIPKSDINRSIVRICQLDDGDEEKRQAGGRRKKRRKTRKNKRSKKKRVKKRKTRKKRKKR